MRLTGGVLALGRSQNLTKDRLGYVSLINACALHDGIQNGSPQIMRWCISKRAAKAAHGRACSRCDYDIRHVNDPHKCSTNGKSGRCNAFVRRPQPAACV
jgi:hypothetical protein